MKKTLLLRIFNVFIALLLVNTFFSCSLPRVIESSEKDRPEWVYGIKEGYIIVEGVGNSWEDAQVNALKKLKERIVNSIAVNVNSEMKVEVNETTINNMSNYSEATDVKTNISTDFFNSIKGISLNKSKAFYWEQQKHQNKTMKVHYHIMYPFTERELNALIMDWEKMDKDFTAELDELEINVRNCSSVPELMILHEKAESLEEIFTGNRKSRASIIKSNIDQLIRNLKFEVQTHERGRLILKLLSSDGYFSMNPQLEFKSSCAVIQDYKLIDNNEAMEVNYDADFCFSEENVSITVEQEYNDIDVESTYTIPEGENTVRFTINEPIRFKQSPSNKNSVKWYFPLRIFTETPFVVSKVELVISQESMIDLHSIIGGDEKETFFVTEVNQEFDSKGDYSLQFEVSTVENSQTTLLGQIINVFMKESSSYYASGKIYLKPLGEEKEYVFVFENKRIIRSQ